MYEFGFGAACTAIRVEETVIGQYTADDEGTIPAYTDDSTVPEGSQTATYAAFVMHIENPRWEGVPFILRAGKALNESKSEIRVQFKKPPGSAMIFPQTDSEGTPREEVVGRNELVIRLQPDQAMYVKFNVQAPGLRGEPVVTEMDLSYKSRYQEKYVALPDAYTFLLLQVLRGDKSSFVREDELRSAWRIFTPLLKAIDSGALPLLKYKARSRGLPEFDQMAQKAGYVHLDNYDWVPPSKL